MKHSRLASYLGDYLAIMGIETSPSEREVLVRHIELVLDANQRVNLTRISDPEEAARLHTADSLAVLGDVGTAARGRLLDLGSGAGFPGIPIAVCSDRTVLLLDSVGKKVMALEAMIGPLGLTNRVSASSVRAEALARTDPAGFAVVTARAVSELPALVELASPLLAQSGRLICLKGSPSRLEISRADKVAGLAGMCLEYQRHFDLPFGAGHRTVLCYRRAGVSIAKLPRREGLAQHSPLA